MSAYIEPKLKEHIKSLFDREFVSEFLIFNGYDVTRDFKLASNQSISIARNGYIKDFGTSNFSGGDLLDFLQVFENISLNSAIQKVANYLNVDTTIKAEFVATAKPIKKEDDKPKYNLEDLNRLFEIEKSSYRNKQLFLELFNSNIIKKIQNSEDVFLKFCGYSKRDDSLTITLKDDNNNIQTIVIRKSIDGIKWKTLGGKTFIYSNIKNESDVVFAVYGMSEILICEMLEFSYIAFQSDSIAKNLSNNPSWNIIKEKLKGKILALLIDYDDSCRDTIKPIKKELLNYSLVVDIEMIDLLHTRIFINATTPLNEMYRENAKAYKMDKLKNEMPKGYDFRDLFNSSFDVEDIKYSLEKMITGELEKWN